MMRRALLISALLLSTFTPGSYSDDGAKKSRPLIPKPAASNYGYLALQREFSEVISGILPGSELGSDEKKIVEKAVALQARHREIFEGVEVGKSVFDYSGLLAQGRVLYDVYATGKAYSLTLGIRPRFAGENDAEKGFTQFLIHFDSAGRVVEKTVPRYRW